MALVESKSNRQAGFLESHTLAGLYLLLESLPQTQILEIHEGTERQGIELDAMIRAKVGSQDVFLLCEVRSALYPRDARFAMSRLREYQRALAQKKSIPVIASQSISQATRKLLRDSQFGYYDTGGSLYLPLNGSFIFIDRPAPRSKLDRASESIFDGKTARIIHALLEDPAGWHSVSALAHANSVAVSTASRTLTRLEKMDLLDSRGIGPSKERRLSSPGRLLDAWGEALPFTQQPSLSRYFVPGLAASDQDQVRAMAKMFERSGIQIAVTHELASQFYAPFLSSVTTMRVRYARSAKVSRVIENLNARKVDSGFNVGLIEVPTRYDLFRGDTKGGIPLASPIQVYLDLMRGEGRAKEAANHLRAEVIRY